MKLIGYNFKLLLLFGFTAGHRRGGSKGVSIPTLKVECIAVAIARRGSVLGKQNKVKGKDRTGK